MDTTTKPTEQARADGPLPDKLPFEKVRRFMRPDALRATAFHEAGHAVVADLLGLDVVEVTIAGTVELAGNVRLRLRGHIGHLLDPADPMRENVLTREQTTLAMQVLA